MLGRRSSAPSPQLNEAVEGEPAEKCQFDISGNIATIEDADSSLVGPCRREEGDARHVQCPDNLRTGEHVNVMDNTGTNSSSSVDHCENVEVHITPLLSGVTGDGSSAYGSIKSTDASEVQGGDIAEAGVTQNLHGGVFGNNGLLSISHVPTLLVMAAIHSVRCTHGEHAKRALCVCVCVPCAESGSMSYERCRTPECRQTKISVTLDYSRWSG